MFCALLLLLPLASAAGAKQPFVKLPEYTAYAQPYEYQLENGEKLTSNVYFALPYAQPPVGDLRLERPKPLNPDKHMIVNKTDLPPGCTQQENMSELSSPDGEKLYPVSEDCLYLNILAPSKVPAKGQKKLPVLVWIHGGGFVYGMSRFYGWQQLARHFNPRGVLVVLIQYRLAFWGYFALGSKAGEAGNYGLWDQTAALQFINTHISSFGGDPKKVSVLGNSAGSVSAHSLSLSPHSHNYFQQTIQSSGSLYNLWSHSRKTIQHSINISKTLGCYYSSSVQHTKNCLKKFTVPEIWEVLKSWGRMRNAMDLLYWGPVMDEDFFVNKSISQLTNQSPIRNTLYGCVKGEALIFTLDTGSVIASVFAFFLGRTVDKQVDYTKADFLQHVNTYLGSEDAAGENVTQIRQLLLDYYTRGGNNVSNLDPKFWYTRFTDAQTDGEFAGGQIVEMGEKMELKWKQHVYIFDYVHPSHVPLIGVDKTYTPHAYEYQYLMDAQPYFPFSKNETNAVERRFTEKIVDAFTSFIKTGNPSTPAVPWPPVDDPVKIKYLQVGKDVVVGNTHFTEIAKLWKKVYSLGYGQQVFNKP